jgi:hypothetical protein
LPERHGDPRFYGLLEEIADLHSRKNHDYAKTSEPLSNFNRSSALGVEPWRGVLVRMSDKWSRIEQLAGGKVAKNESLRDSLIDLAVYSLIDILLLEDAERAKHGAKALDPVTLSARAEQIRDQALALAEPEIEQVGPNSFRRKA